MDSSPLQALYYRLSGRHRPVPAAQQIAPQRIFFETYFDDVRQAKEALTREAKLKEKPEFEKFINTGIPGSYIRAFLTPHGKVQIVGNDVQNGRVLMVMDKKSITANAKRSNHVKKTIKELAKREGLALNFTNAILEQSDGISVAFWHFKNSKEVDDSDLIGKAEARAEVRPASDRRPTRYYTIDNLPF